MEEKRVLGFTGLLPMLILLMTMSAIPSSSLRDPFVGLPFGGERVSSNTRCCNDCTCVDTWCICSDRSRFGCFRHCGFCQCYDKPERTCYCIDVLNKCPPPCVLTPDAPAGVGN